MVLEIVLNHQYLHYIHDLYNNQEGKHLEHRSAQGLAVDAQALAPACERRVDQRDFHVLSDHVNDIAQRIDCCAVLQLGSPQGFLDLLALGDVLPEFRHTHDGALLVEDGVATQ